MSEKIIDMNMLTQFENDMTRYSIYVSRKRITPEYRDGFKPIHRRIMFCMYEYIKCIDKFVKSAAVVGRTIETVHPHGDSSVYDAMKPMINWFEINVPLIEGQGSFGAIQGGSAAAQRYTEVKLSKFAYECVIGELKESKFVVDWMQNYDGTKLEPQFLPVTVPLLLINGSFGIGVGMKVEIPRHNINEVIDATLSLIDNPETPILLIPDHSTKCNIIKGDFQSICNKGIGSYKVRGIIDIETYKGGRHDGATALVIKSTPDLVFLDSITEKISNLIVENKIIQIDEVIEETSLKGMRFVIILKKGSDPNYVRDIIFKHTDMEKSCRVNFEVLDDITPIRMSYRQYILAWLDQRKLTKFRLYCNKLQTVQTKKHERDAYIKVLQSGDIDNIINMLKNRTTIDDNEVIEYLIKTIHITDLQAEYIINCTLKKLSVAYLNKYIAEAEEYDRLANIYLQKTIYDELILEEIKEDLIKCKEKYGRPRNCRVIDLKSESNIPKGEFKLVITENNFVKKIQVNETVGNYKGDSPKRVLKVDNAECVLLFDEMGKMFKLPVHKVPLTERNNSGIDIRVLIKNLTSNINTVMYEPIVKYFADKIEKHYIVTVSAFGNIKKMDLGDFLTTPPSGIVYSKLEEGDVIKDIMLISDKLDIIVYSDSVATRINMASIPNFKRNTKGSRSMISNELIDGVSIIRDDTTDIVVITEKGYVNRFTCGGMAVSEKGQKGNTVIKLAKGDKIHSIYGLNERESIRVTTRNGKLDLIVNELPVGSSVGAGKKIIPLKGDTILRCDIIK